MSRSIQIAAVQMDGRPTNRTARLQRAANLIAQAVHDGAQLVVLPAYFTTGLHYEDTLYEQTEMLDGETLRWLCDQAAQHDIHLTGTWLVVEHDDTYHAAFLVTPDGLHWRYDAHYPYLWERVFFRDAQRLTVADTDLGKIGLMINWDAAHSHLWERYAAKVDVMVIFSALQNTEQLEAVFPTGERAGLNVPATLMGWLARRASHFLDADLARQAHWSRIPVAISGLSGSFSSVLPAPLFSWYALLASRPEWWSRVKQHYADMRLEAPFRASTRLLNRDGDTVVTVTQAGDQIAQAVFDIGAHTPQPRDKMPQPRFTIPDIVYALIDGMSAALYTFNYRRGVRRQWGARMAPVDTRTRVWLWILGLTAAFVVLLMRLIDSKPRR